MNVTAQADVRSGDKLVATSGVVYTKESEYNGEGK